MTFNGNPGLLTLLIIGGAFFSVMMAVGGFALAGLSSRRKLRQRVDSIRKRAMGVSATSTAELRIDNNIADMKGVGWLVKILPNINLLRLRLEKTGRPITPSQYILACLGLGLFTALIFIFVLGQGLPIALLVGIVAGVGVPHFAIGRMGTRRVNKFIGHFAEAIDLIVRGLKSGLPVSESIGAVGREMPDPVGTEFRRVSDAVRFGQEMEDALWAASKRIDTPDFKFFVISLAVQKETGGNLSETLENLTDVLRRRRQMKLKIKAMSSEAKASAMIIGSLPFVLMGLLFFISSDYIQLLFTDPRGNIMAGVGFGLQLLGVVVMAKMVKFEI